MALMANGDLIIGGVFPSVGGVTAPNLARWDGSNWSAVDSSGGADARINTLLALPSGDVLAGGEFQSIGGGASPYFSQLTTTCPATAVKIGSGCTGTGGANVLQQTTPAFLGSTFEAMTSGLATPSLALSVFGFNQVFVPLSGLLAEGQAGCDLLVSADVLVLLTGNGQVHSQAGIGNDPSIIGQSFYHQVVPFELGAGGNIVAFTSSNALMVTVGSF